MARSNATLLQATSSFITRIGGVDVMVKAGDLADPDSEVVRKYRTLFVPVAVRFGAEQRVEAATAAPGEKRGA